MDAVFDDGLELADQRSSGDQTSEEEEPLAQLTVFYANRPPVPYKLRQGVNVVGRQSSFAQRDALRLHQWSMDYTGTAVHGIFLEGSSVSSAHAVIYLEGWGDSCFVKDLKSRNKTFIKRGGKHVAIEPEKKLPLRSGDVLTFGALKCRIAFGGQAEGGASPPSGSSPSGGGIFLPPRAISTAVSIGQRTVAPGTPTGRSMSLDKCPSLQEWFQHPARSPSGSLGGQPTPFSGVLKSRGWDDETGGSSRASLEMSSKPSFGFGPTIHEAEENTSSEPEPETPRIDRPSASAFSSPQQKQSRSPFAGNLAPTTEENHEDDGAEASAATTVSHPATDATEEQTEAPKSGRSSLELGAATLAQLKAVPLKGSLSGQPAPPSGSLASLPGTPNTEELSPGPTRSPSPVPNPATGGRSASAGRGGDGDYQRGRPIRVRQKMPTPKRSRSGRVTSPDKSQHRSKSPRLQRGFDVTRPGEPLKMDEIRDAMRDIWSDI